MGHIFLIGFMGSGKSSVGKGLSERMGRPLLDTDHMIEEMAKKPISRIFSEEGEAHFRELETKVLKELPTERGFVISCGGGMALKEENVRLMKEKGKVVFLQATPETILNRVKSSNKRPILEGNKNIPFISELMEKRVPFYNKASDMEVIVDDKSILEICDEILSGLTY